MAININNNVLLQTNTPYSLTLTDQAIPTANNYPDGTLLFIRDSNLGTTDMYQSFFDLNVWAQIGTGGGGSQGFDDVLGVDPNVYSSYTSQFQNNYSWTLEDFTYLQYISTTTSSITAFWKIDATQSYFGYQNTSTSKSGFLHIDNTNNSAGFKVNTGDPEYIGIATEFVTGATIIGDNNALFGGPTYIEISPFSDTIYMRATNYVQNNTDSFEIAELSSGGGRIKLYGSGYTTATGGNNGTSHLRIFINGLEYTIQLKAV